MNRPFLAVCCWLLTWAVLSFTIPLTWTAIRNRDRLMTAVTITAGLGLAAVLANAGADLW